MNWFLITEKLPRKNRYLLVVVQDGLRVLRYFPDWQYDDDYDDYDGCWFEKKGIQAWAYISLRKLQRKFPYYAKGETRDKIISKEEIYYSDVFGKYPFPDSKKF